MLKEWINLAWNLPKRVAFDPSTLRIDPSLQKMQNKRMLCVLHIDYNRIPYWPQGKNRRGSRNLVELEDPLFTRLTL